MFCVLRLQMVWIETPTNPTLQMADIKAVCDIVHKQPNVFVVVDNTFMTPYFQVCITLQINPHAAKQD